MTSTPRTSLEAVRAALSGLIEEFNASSGYLADDEGSPVHDLRTSTRRLRSLLSSVGDVLGAPATRQIIDKLREVGEWLESARTAQVHRETAQRLLYDESRADYPDELREQLVRAALREESAARSSAAQQLDSDSFFAVRQDLAEFISRPPLGKYFSEDPDTRIPKILEKQARRARKRLRAMDVDDLNSLHSARKAARRFRYVTEALSSEVTSAHSKSWIRASASAAAFQDAVGDHRDTSLFLDYLAERAATAAAAGEDPSFHRELDEAERATLTAQSKKIRKYGAELRSALKSVL